MTDKDKTQFTNSLAEKISRFKSLARDFRLGNASAEQEIRLQAGALTEEAKQLAINEIVQAAQAVEKAGENELITRLAGLTKLMAAGDNTTAPQQEPGILIIEEDAQLAEQFANAIRGQFIDDPISIASTNKEAQELLLKQPFSTILLSLIMPDGDGRELLHDIKYEYALPASVIVLSPVNNDKVRVECMRLGAEKFLLKPVNVNELASLVKKLLKKFEKQELSLVPIGSEAAAEEDIEYAPIEKNEQQQVSVHGQKILLVEDEPMQANLTKMRLTKQGLTVVHAKDGKEALELLKQDRYSLVILDIMMPVLDGFTVLKVIRKDQKLQSTPVIIVSGMGSEDDIIQGYDLGATDYILKPFSPVHLIARVKSLLKD